MRPTTEDETRCVVDGVEYHAETTTNCCHSSEGGRECAAMARSSCGGFGPCIAELRADRSHVIWVRAE